MITICKMFVATVLIMLSNSLVLKAQLNAEYNLNKKITASSDSIKAEMITTDGDDIIFSLYDNKMNKIKVDNITGKCILIFYPEVHVPLEITKIDQYRFKCTLLDLKRYIKLIRCELKLLIDNKNKQFLFINQ